MSSQFDFTVLFEDAYIFPPTSVIAEFRVSCCGDADGWWIEEIEVKNKDCTWSKVMPVEDLYTALYRYATHNDGYLALDNAYAENRAEWRETVRAYQRYGADAYDFM